jgi:hypothetical protein
MTTLRVRLPVPFEPSAPAAWWRVDARGIVMDRGVSTAAAWPAADRIEAVLGAPDVRIVALDQDHPDLDTAATVVAETPGHYIEGFALFDGVIAVQEVHDATSTVRLVGRTDGADRGTLDFGPLGVTALEQNEDAALPFLRVTFESATLPPVLYQVDLATGAKTELPASWPPRRTDSRCR